MKTSPVDATVDHVVASVAKTVPERPRMKLFLPPTEPPSAPAPSCGVGESMMTTSSSDVAASIGGETSSELASAAEVGEAVLFPQPQARRPASSERERRKPSRKPTCIGGVLFTRGATASEEQGLREPLESAFALDPCRLDDEIDGDAPL
jgi:hypothetical protein